MIRINDIAIAEERQPRSLKQASEPSTLQLENVSVPDLDLSATDDDWLTGAGVAKEETIGNPDSYIDEQSLFSRDEGYATASYVTYRQEQKPTSTEAETDNADNATIYSNAPSLPRSMKEGYMAELADNLLDILQSEAPDFEKTKDMSESIPNLLQAFAFRIGHLSQSQMHRDIMFYVHKHRKDLAQYFQSKCTMVEDEDTCTSELARNQSDQMTLLDKMSMWSLNLDTLSLVNKDQDQIKGHSALEENLAPKSPADDKIAFISTGVDSDILNPQFQGYKESVFKSPAYQWLLGTLRQELLLSCLGPNYMGTIRQDILNAIPNPSMLSRRESPRGNMMMFAVDWSPIQFIREQGYIEEEMAISRSITITGSEIDAQAMTCQRYLYQTWPISSPSILQLIEKIVQSGGCKQECTLPDNTKVIARISKSQLEALVHGPSDSIAEIGEQLAWLGASLRSSPKSTSNICLCRSFIHQIGSTNALFGKSEKKILKLPKCVIRFEMNALEKPTPSQDGQCWHDLFRNPVVVEGFPIKRRSEQDTGLEIPLNILAGLAETKWIDTFKSRLFIKGLSTLLVPVKHLGETVIWHAIYNTDGNRISYLDCKLSPVDINTSTMEAARHIVGWCGDVKHLAGAVDAEYAMKKSGLPRTFAGCAMEGVFIRRNHIIKGRSPYSLGFKDVPIRLVSRDQYVEKLRWARKQFVILWDQRDKRGWLVNGTSALLHLTRATLEFKRQEESEFNIESDSIFKSELLDEGIDSHRSSSALNTLKSPRNRALKVCDGQGENKHVSFEDEVEKVFCNLEKIIEHQIDIAATEWKIKGSKAPRKYLEGWDFRDLATDEDLISSRVSTLDVKGKSWIDFTRSIRAVTLFARGYGEIFRPNHVDNQSCTHWRKLPSHNSYLACCQSDLNAIIDRYGDEEANPKILSEGIIWYNPEQRLDCPCPSGDNHIDLTQVLLPLNLSPNISRKAAKERIMNWNCRGAVAFGYSSTAKWRWDDTGDPVQHELDISLAKQVQSPGTPNPFYDSGLGTNSTSSMIDSNNTQQTDRQEHRQTSAISTELFRLGIICALPKEMMAVRALFDSEPHSYTSPDRDTNCYVLGRILHHNVVATCLPENGTNAAANVVSHLRRTFASLEFCLLVGIGGGIPTEEHDIRLGDVVVGHSGFIQYDLGKERGSAFERTSNLQQPPRLLMNAIANIRSNVHLAHAPLQASLEKLQMKLPPEYISPGPSQDTLFSIDLTAASTPVDRTERESMQPWIHYGRIASGNRVIKDAHTRNRIGVECDALCVEMEAAGIMDIVPCLVIRGISDYADSYKCKGWQEYAALTAAAYAMLLLSSVGCPEGCIGLCKGQNTMQGQFSKKRPPPSLTTGSSSKRVR